MTKKILPIQITLLFCLFQAQAQNSFNPGGGDAAAPQANVSYSIGQPFYEPFSSYGGTLKATPGVQQVYSISAVSINEIKANIAGIKLYPNPATDYLELSFNSEDTFDNLQAALYDLSGSLTGLYPINIPLTRIQTGTLEPGVYLLKVTSGNAEIKVFKVIKK